MDALMQDKKTFATVLILHWPVLLGVVSRLLVVGFGVVDVVVVVITGAADGGVAEKYQHCSWNENRNLQVNKTIVHLDQVSHNAIFGTLSEIEMTWSLLVFR